MSFDIIYCSLYVAVVMNIAHNATLNATRPYFSMMYTAHVVYTGSIIYNQSQRHNLVLFKVV